jgi:hypothetical protein
MRKIFVIVSAIFCSLILVLAQTPSTISSQTSTSGNPANLELEPRDHDDHNDGGPIQVGYAVVTPASFSTNGTNNLVVFETFGLREGLGATQAGVLPPDLTTNALLFVDSDGALQKNLGVAIVNPNGSNENVTLTLRGSDGHTLGSTTVSVPSHQQISKFITELFASQSAVPKNVTGTLAVTSTDPVSVIGLRFRGSNFSTLPITNLANTGTVPALGTGIGGPGAVLLPQFAAGGGWATELVIVNDGTSSMTVRVDLFKQDGTPLSTALNNQPAASSYPNIVIPAGGVFVLAPRNGSGGDDF